MKHIIILSALALCLSVCSMTAMAQNVTIHKQGGVGHVYEMEQVDSVVYFPIGDTEQFPAQETENTTTLWDVINAQPNLKRFATILKAATYYSAKGKPTGLHFDQVLGLNTPLNVYAPGDAAISNALYATLLNQANTDGWKLQQEFIAGHISPQECSSLSGSVVTMLNGKLIKKNTINVQFTSTEAAYGNVYVLSAVLPYSPNMKEYLMEVAPDCSQAQQFMAEADWTYLDLTKSVSVPSTDGTLQILERVYTTHNKLMDSSFMDDDLMCAKGFGADLANEDANYRMVMPTDDVWNDAQAKLAPLYKYSSRYENKILGNEGKTGAAIAMYITSPDSISALSMGADILVPLLGRTSSGQKTTLSNGTAYAASEWPVPASKYKPDVEVELETTAQDIVGYRTYFVDSIGGGDHGESESGYSPWFTDYTSPEDIRYDAKNDKYYNAYDYIYDEGQDKYYYIKRDYINVPDTIYAEDGTIIDVILLDRIEDISYISLERLDLPEINPGFIYYKDSNKNKLGFGTQCLPFNNERYAEISSKYGRVSNNNFYYLSAPSATSGPKAEIKFQGKNGEQVMSGKYDIQVVVVPYWYTQLYDVRKVGYDAEGNNNPHTQMSSGSIPADWRDETGQLNEQVIDSIAAISKQKFKATLSYNNNASIDKKFASTKNEYIGLKVDTLTVIEDFEFPYSYKNISSSYPTLYIECTTSKTDAKKGFIYNLCIDKIILKSKEDGSVTEVTP